MQKHSELKSDNRHEGNARVTLLERLFSRESRYLPLILKLQLAFLFVLVVIAFVLPLSGSERGIVVAMAPWNELGYMYGGVVGHPVEVL